MIEKSSGCRPVPVAIGAVTLTLVTALASFLVASSLLPKPNCDMPKLTFPKDNPEWHEVDRMEVPDKNLIISRPLGANRCYVLPKRSPTEDDTPRPLIIINEPLSFQMLEHLAGSDAAAFCNGYDTFLARELKGDEAAATERNKRQAYGSNPAPAPAPQPSGGYSAPPAPPQPASQPSGGYSAPPAPQPAPQPSGGYSAPPAPQPSGGYSAPPAPEPASQPSGGYSAPPAPQPAPQPSGGYSAPPPAPQPSGGYSAPPPQPASQTGGSGGSGGYGGGAGGAAPNAASGAAANAGGVAVGAGQSAAAALSPLTGSAWTGEGIFGTAKDTGKSALQMGIDERTPRCTEVLLDCVDHVGQVQSCYTWVNGVLWMDRKCTDSKQFVIRMTKPPGRILKIAQQQWIECLKRRNEGKTC